MDTLIGQACANDLVSVAFPLASGRSLLFVVGEPLELGDASQVKQLMLGVVDLQTVPAL